MPGENKGKERKKNWICLKCGKKCMSQWHLTRHAVKYHQPPKSTIWKK